MADQITPSDLIPEAREAAMGLRLGAQDLEHDGSWNRRQESSPTLVVLAAIMDLAADDLDESLAAAHRTKMQFALVAIASVIGTPERPFDPEPSRAVMQAADWIDADGRGLDDVLETMRCAADLIDERCARNAVDAMRSPLRRRRSRGHR